MKSGDACPNCGARVRAPMWRVAIARIVLGVMIVVLGAASIIGVGMRRVGEGTRGQPPRITYATTCKACGERVELAL